MRKICLALVTSFFCFPLKAQEANNENLLKLTHVSLIYGVADANHGVITSTDFLDLAAGSVIDLSQYKILFMGAQNTDVSLSALATFYSGKKDDNVFFEGPIIRLGVSGWGNAESGMTLKNSMLLGSDTLTSASTGQQVVADTTMLRQVSILYSNSGIMLDASVLFSTNREKRWKFYAGAGITSGLTMDAQTQTFSSLTQQIAIRPVQGSNHYYDRRSEVLESREEVYRNKTTFIGSLFIPAGVEFSLGRKRPFWKRLDLRYEIRTGVHNSSIAELDQQIDSFFSQGIGITLRLNSEGEIRNN